VIELRSHNWVDRNQVAAPTAIAEVHGKVSKVAHCVLASPHFPTRLLDHEQCKNAKHFFVRPVFATLPAEDDEIPDVATMARLKSVLMDGQPQSPALLRPNLVIYRSSARSIAVLACSLDPLASSPSVARSVDPRILGILHLYEANIRPACCPHTRLSTLHHASEKGVTVPKRKCLV
jgi:hypothetical protein